MVCLEPPAPAPTQQCMVWGLAMATARLQTQQSLGFLLASALCICPPEMPVLVWVWV